MKLIAYILLASIVISCLVENIYMSFGLHLLGFILFLFLKNGSKLKTVEILILGYALTSLIPYFKYSPEFFWGNYAIIISTFIVIYVCSRLPIKLHLSLLKSILLLQIPIFLLQLLILYGRNGFLLKYQIGIPFGDSNLIASISLFNSILLLFWEDFSLKSFNIKQMRVILLLGSVLCLVLTQSFAAMIILFFFLLLWMLKKITWRSRLALIITGACITILLVPLMEDRTKLGRIFNLMSVEQLEIIDREKSIRAQREQSEFLHGRFEVYGMAIRNFSENPVFGKGLGNLTDYKNMFNEPTFRAHNLLLDLLATSGLVGCMLYISFLLLFIIRAFRLLREPSSNALVNRAISYGLFALIIHSMAEPNFMTFKFDSMVFISLSILLNQDNVVWEEIG